MTSTNAVSGTTNSATGSTSQNKVMLGKEDFLRLLLAQLQYQDPLEPLTNTEFVAQLAQFSSLEQLFGLNTNLSYLQLYAASLNNSQAVSFIGKQIKALGNSLYISPISTTNNSTLYYELAADADTITIAIYDDNGQLVRTINQAPQKAGEYQYTWDGKDDKGMAVPQGDYTYKVTATDSQGQQIKTTTYVVGTVTGLLFDNGVTYLVMGKQKIALGNVIEVS